MDFWYIFLHSFFLVRNSDYSKASEIAELGYQAAMPVLKEWLKKKNKK